MKAIAGLGFVAMVWGCAAPKASPQLVLDQPGWAKPPQSSSTPSFFGGSRTLHVIADPMDHNRSHEMQPDGDGILAELARENPGSSFAKRWQAVEQRGFVRLVPKYLVEVVPGVRPFRLTGGAKLSGTAFWFTPRVPTIPVGYHLENQTLRYEELPLVFADMALPNGGSSFQFDLTKLNWNLNEIGIDPRAKYAVNFNGQLTRGLSEGLPSKSSEVGKSEMEPMVIVQVLSYNAVHPETHDSMSGQILTGWIAAAGR